MKKLLRNKKGFTLIELIVVILILAVLAAILVPSIINYVTEARTSAAQANARQLYSEIAIRRVETENLAVDDSNLNIPDTCVILNGATELSGSESIGDNFVVRCNGITFNGTELGGSYTTSP